MKVRPGKISGFLFVLVCFVFGIKSYYIALAVLELAL